ncbi:hypothetical protein KI387_008178, partial [Taxus chinensis]
GWLSERWGHRIESSEVIGVEIRWSFLDGGGRRGIGRSSTEAGGSNTMKAAGS